MTGTDDADETHRYGRRSFLARSGAALFGVGLGARAQEGGGGGGREQEDDRGDVEVVLPNVPPLRPEFFRDVFMLTDPTDRRRGAAEFADCGLDPSGPYDVYQGLAIDRAAAVQILDTGDLSKLGQMKTTTIYVPPAARDIRIGSPYIITGGDYCADNYVKVRAHPLPHPLRGGTAPADVGTSRGESGGVDRRGRE